MVPEATSGEAAASYRPRPDGRRSRAPTESAGNGRGAQGARTRRRLLDAGIRAFAERGYHAARVDDIARGAAMSHGTFYLYFSNKQALLHALASECAAELRKLPGSIGSVDPGPSGYAVVRDFVARFVSLYRRFGPVIRVWMEGEIDDRALEREGRAAFVEIATTLRRRMLDAGIARQQATARSAALMALLERFSYGLASGRRIGSSEPRALDDLARFVHRGFFGATAT